MNFLNDSRSPFTRRLSIPTKLPIDSDMPSGSYSICTMTLVRRLVELVEGDDAVGAALIHRLPRDSMVRVLLLDLSVPLPLLAADLRRPVQRVSPFCSTRSTPSMNCGNDLELRPLVVRRGDRNLDLDRFLDRSHFVTSCSWESNASRGQWSANDGRYGTLGNRRATGPINEP